MLIGTQVFAATAVNTSSVSSSAPLTLIQVKPLNTKLKSVQNGQKLQRVYMPPVHTPKQIASLPPTPKIQNVASKPAVSATKISSPVVSDEKITSPIKVGTTADIPTYNKISLQDAIDYALSHNLDIKGNRINITKSKNDIKAANQLKNPYVQFYGNTGTAAIDNPNSAGLMFPIEIAKRSARKKLAKSNLELTKGNVSLAELILRLDVRQAYIDLVSAKSTLKILNENRKLLVELLNVAQMKFDAGAVPEMDVIHAKMTLNQLLIQFNTANTNVYVARYNFNKLLNSTNFDSKEDYLPDQKDNLFLLTPKTTDKMPEFKELADIAVNKRLDLKNAKQDIDVAKKNLAVIIRQRIPDLEIGGGYIFVLDQMSSIDKNTQGVYVGGNITNIPLLYQYSPEIKNAKLQVEQKQIAYDALKNQAMMDLHAAYDQYTTARDNLNYYTDILLSESNQFVKMAKRSYDVGKSNITDLIFIEQSYKAILMGYSDALSDYYDAWVEVLRQLNDEDLKLHG